MGRTLPTFNTLLQHEIESWRAFRRALRADDKERFDRLFTHVRTFTAEGTAASRAVPFDAMVIAMLLGQQREIEELRAEVEALRRAREERQGEG